MNARAYASATTHYLVLEDVEVHVRDPAVLKCNVTVNWSLHSEPEFAQSTGTRFDTKRAHWPARRKYALNRGHSHGAGAGDGSSSSSSSNNNNNVVSTLVLDVVIVDPRLPDSRTEVSEDTGLIEGDPRGPEGMRRETDAFAYARSTFQYAVPLGDLSYAYADNVGCCCVGGVVAAACRCWC